MENKDNINEMCREIREKNLLMRGKCWRIRPDKNVMEALLKRDYTTKEIGKQLGINGKTASTWIKQMELKSNYSNRNMDEKTKKRISSSVKKYLLKHPEHPFFTWERKISVPCERLKQQLKERNIKFEEESKVLRHLGYLYKGDIVFPEQSTIVEINGSQHYDTRCPNKLRKYYQKRHDILEQNGWRVLEVPVQNTYHKEFLDELISVIFNKEHKFEANLEYRKFSYLKSCQCGKLINHKSKQCMECYRKQLRKCPFTKSELHYLMWNYSMNKIQKKFHVYKVIIKHWFSIMNFQETPDKRYWARLQTGGITDYQI